MRYARDILSRYRLLILAILLSASLHAALIVGAPGRAAIEEGSPAAIYTASLEPEGMRVEDAAGQPAPKPASRKPRPKKVSPPRPEEIVASVPEPAERPASEPPVADSPEPEPEQKPETVALAPLAAPLREPEPPPPERFPTDALPGTSRSLTR
jgi:outer membrane biosynthesis protein TonB